MASAGFIKKNRSGTAEGLRFTLAPDCQVREEDFGLLFYTASGPGLYFVSSGDLLGEDFFLGRHTLEEWRQQRSRSGPWSEARLSELKKTLDTLKGRGVILAC
jgi:putative mycofactocin binding protein MftB